jgi:fluoride exporter
MKATELILVFLGSGLGGASRYAISIAFVRAFSSSSFPWATLGVNILGSCCLGLLCGLYPDPQSRERILLGVGFLGGFTTFSTLMWDSYRLKPAFSIANLLLSVAFGLLAVWVGHKLTGRSLAPQHP